MKLWSLTENKVEDACKDFGCLVRAGACCLGAAEWYVSQSATRAQELRKLHEQKDAALDELRGYDLRQWGAVKRSEGNGAGKKQAPPMVRSAFHPYRAGCFAGRNWRRMRGDGTLDR